MENTLLLIIEKADKNHSNQMVLLIGNQIENRVELE